jgi:hypothetical protein
MAEVHDVTATQAAEQLSQNVWIKLIAGFVVLAIFPGALYGKNYLDQRFETVDRRFASVEEKLSTAASKDKTDDGAASEMKQRIAIMESNMLRGKEDRERFQLQTLAVLQTLQAGQQRQAELLAGLIATVDEMKRQTRR